MFCIIAQKCSIVIVYTAQEVVMFYENLLAICKERGVKVTNVVTSLGFSQGSMSSWKNGVEPRANTVKKFADFFGVSVDYLIGHDADTDAPQFSPDMLELIEMIGEDKELLNKALDFTRFMKSQRGK